MDTNLNDLLELFPEPTAVIFNGTIVAANSEAKRDFFSQDEIPVVLELSELEVEIDGTRYVFAINLKNDHRLFIAASANSDENPYTHLLRNISGYLREEIGVTRASLSLLNKKVGSVEETRKYFNIIRKSQSKLHRLADNLTDTLDDEESKLFLQTVDLSELCYSLISTVSALIDNRNSTIKFEKQDNLIDCVTLGDPVKLERMMLNLISNSLRNAPKIGCVVKVTLVRSDNNFIITVSDNSGNGLPQDANQPLFSAYQYADPYNSRGLGLGLTAALHIARQHGGNIIAVRHENGSTFNVKIPRKPIDATLKDYSDFFDDNPMARVLSGLSDVASWEKYGIPYIDANL